jgi:hypothetical protein
VTLFVSVRIKMDIEQMKEEGGHGVDPEVIRRAEYFLYSMKWKVAPYYDGVLDEEDDPDSPRGLILSASNNTTNELPYSLHITFAPDGGMNISFDAHMRQAGPPFTDADYEELQRLRATLKKKCDSFHRSDSH